MPEELWTEVYDTVQKAVIKATSKKKKCRKQDDYLRRPYNKAEKRREAKDKGEKERYTHLNAAFQRIARSDK